MKRITSIILRAVMAVAALVPAIAADAQTDTLVTRLREVRVVGVKQSAADDLSVTTTIARPQIEQYGVLTMKDAAQFVPNLYMPSYGSRMTSSIYARGIGARIDQPVVGLNVDGVPYLNKDCYDFDLFDIRSIEVLRGAQSILNGRNTMAGQINIVTLSPWQYQGVRAMAEYGRANTLRVGAGYYGRVSSTLATAVTLYATHTDGYFTNDYNGGSLDKETQGTLRWKLAWHPSTRLSVTNTASAQLSRQGGYPYMHLSTGKISYNDTCYYRRTAFTDGLTVGWTGKRVLVTSVTSVQYLDDDMTLDQDFRPEPYFTLSQTRRETTVTEDLYCRGTRGRVDWLGGVFGFLKHTSMEAPVTFKEAGISNLIENKPNDINPQYPIRWDERSFVLGSDFTTVTKGIAAYGRATLNSGPWKVEAGLRLDIERASLDYRSHCNTGYTVMHVLDDGSTEVFRQQPVVIDDRGKLHHTYTQLLPKIAAGYTFASGISVFANIAKGYKSGGFNVQMFSDVLQQRVMELMGITKLYDIDDIISYKPEKSINYEIGVKAPVGVWNAEVDATLFYISCTDQQLTVFPPGLTTGRVMTNAGKTRSYGVEVSVHAEPTATVTVDANYGYTNARFVRYDNGRADLSGNRLPYAPSNTIFGGVQWRLPVSVPGFTTTLGVNARAVGDIWWDDENLVRQPLYATLGATLTLTSPHFTIQLWGENLTNTRYDTFYFVSVGNAFVQRANPVTYGVTLRYQL